MQGSELERPLQRVEQHMQQLARQGSGPAGEMAAAHLAAGGARVRARLALAAARSLGRSPEEAVAIAAACELLHNASLVHDDLQDRDSVRRGRVAVWREHGDAAAICVGDLLLSAAYAAIAGCGVAAAPLLLRLHQRVAAVVRGQCSDISLRGASNVTLARYEEVAAGKSGPLLSLPIELALLLADQGQHLPLAVSAAERFAVAYQITDDLEDVERDALNEEINVVAVLAAEGVAAPLQSARELALTRFCAARDSALLLPRGAGRLLADYAAARARALGLQEVSA